MEEIYQPKRFVCTERKQMKEYFQLYSDNLLIDDKECMIQNKFNEDMPHLQESNLNEAIFSFINDNTLDDNARDELVELCSPNVLKIPEERAQIGLKNLFGTIRLAKRYKPYDVVPESLHLETVKNCEKKYSETKGNIFRNEVLHPNEPELDGCAPKTTEEKFLTPGKDFAVIVRFFRPFQSNYSLNTFKARSYAKFDQEIIISSQNTLADLKDKIICVANKTTLTDISDKVNHFGKVEYSMDKYPSSFIFIDGVFYNDFRNPSSKDYSEIIRKWAIDRNVGHFQTSEQDKVEIGSLNPRFGYPYVFQHHGRCEHIFFFAQARVINTEDNLKLSEYPYISKVGNCKCVNCYICGTSVANWIIIDCDRLPDDKSPLCDVCFKSYCYVNGSKVGSFKAFPFLCKKVALTQTPATIDQQMDKNNTNFDNSTTHNTKFQISENSETDEHVNIKIELVEASDTSNDNSDNDPNSHKNNQE